MSEGDRMFRPPTSQYTHRYPTGQHMGRANVPQTPPPALPEPFPSTLPGRQSSQQVPPVHHPTRAGGAMPYPTSHQSYGQYSQSHEPVSQVTRGALPQHMHTADQASRPPGRNPVPQIRSEATLDHNQSGQPHHHYREQRSHRVIQQALPDGDPDAHRGNDTGLHERYSEEDSESNQIGAEENQNPRASRSSVERDGDVNGQTQNHNCRPQYVPAEANSPRTALLLVAKDETEMLGEHHGYHERITGEEAERRLKLFDRHCYLTRFSKNMNCYVLTVYQRQRPEDVIIHFKICISQLTKKLNIEGKSKEFEDIRELLRYYEQNRIDPGLKSIGRVCTQQEYELAEERHLQEERRRQEEQRRLDEARRQEDERRLQEEERIRQEAERRRFPCTIL